MRRLALLATLAAVALAPAGARADGLEVRFLKPRELQTAMGNSTVQVFVAVPPGVAVERIELSVDRQPLATLTAPPWQLEWDAGDGSRDHRLDAVLYTSDGRSARAWVRTTALKVDAVERVDLVNLYLVVRNRQGDYVPGLGQGDFRIFEEKREQTIERFSTNHKPLRVAIVLDTSWSMRGDKLEKAKSAGMQFLDILEPDDEGLVVTFADRVQVAQELTRDRHALAAAIEGAMAGGGTALYDAVWRTSRLLDDFDGRRVLVLLSDGRDEASNGLEPGSLHTLDEAVDQSLRSEAMIFTIALGNDLKKEYVRRWNASTGLSSLDQSLTILEVLERMAGATGGRAVMAASEGRLGRAFSDVAADLRNQYSVAYVSDNPTRDGKWRKVDVTARGGELDVVTRKGYYARGTVE